MTNRVKSPEERVEALEKAMLALRREVRDLRYGRRGDTRISLT